MIINPMVLLSNPVVMIRNFYLDLKFHNFQLYLIMSDYLYMKEKRTIQSQ